MKEENVIISPYPSSKNEGWHNSLVNSSMVSESEVFHNQVVHNIIKNKQNIGFKILDSLDSYQILGKVGEGTYGRVFRARHKVTHEIVALKKILYHHSEGIPSTALRELSILQNYKHPNVVGIKSVITSKQSIYFVLEYMQGDLQGIIKNPSIHLSISQIKYYFLQIVKAVAFCHERHIIHRDLKLSNVLLNNQGDVKLADFGLAKELEGENIYLTNSHAMSLYQRPPEVILGDTHYTYSADMWSVGCLLFELYIHRPLIVAKDEISQLFKIFDYCGTPSINSSLNSLPLMEHLPSLKPIPSRLKYSLKKYIKDSQAVDLIARCMTLDPEKRITAKDAINHPYFKTSPLPSKTDDLPKFENSTHWYTLKYGEQENVDPSP